VKAHGEPLLEAHILDFSGDLYGRPVRVDFLHKFRDEKKFADLETLTREIARDVEAARAYFAACTVGTRNVMH
jgi:riboflavin kinase/FMN adenylyltransferase